VGSEPVGGVADPGWFEFYDETITVDPSSEADRAFLAGLRARTVSHAWPIDSYDTFAYHAIDDEQHVLRVGVWLDDPETRWALLTWVLEFDGTRIVGGEARHDIPFDLQRRADATIERSGSVEFLLERAGEWFERVLSWPIERREWFGNGELLYREWVLASTERRLTGQLKPRPVRAPDRVTLVRGVREPEADHGGRRTRGWGFGTRRGT
jgi:hypothetical protein